MLRKIRSSADEAVNIAHAKKYAPLIPYAKTLWLEGEGHILREKAMPAATEAMLMVFESTKN